MEENGRMESPYEVAHKQKLNAIEAVRKKKQRRYRELLRKILKLPEGREFISTFFDMSYMHLDPYTGNSDTSYICGLQRAARELAVHCQHADIEMYQLMQREELYRNREEESE